MPRGKEFTVAPFEDEISFRQLQIKHGHFLEQRDLPTPEDVVPQGVNKHSKSKGYLPNHKIKIKKRGKKEKQPAPGQADDLDNSDDVPKYIYTTRKRPVYHDSDSLDRKKARAAKQSLKAKRRLVDTMVADYLCNHKYGHVIPVYEGTGLRTCPCCVNRNRENVRSVLGLPADPDNIVSQPQINPWFNKGWDKAQKQKSNIYPAGIQRKPVLRMDPSFRLTDTATRKNWETSANLEDPDFYKDQIRTYPYGADGTDGTFYHTFLKPGSQLGYLPSFRDTSKRNYWPNMRYSNERNYFRPMFRFNSSNMYDSRSLISADRRYDRSMDVLRKYTYRY